MNLRLVIIFAAGVLGATGAYAAGDASKAVTTVCLACHMDGTSPVMPDPTAAGQPPNLAGHPAEYISKQLTDYKSGARVNPMMNAMVAALTPDDIANLGAYYGSQKPKPGIAGKNGPGSLGEKIYKGGIPASGIPACSACHGPTGAGITAQFPRLAGQHIYYTLLQMKAFRSGERANDPAMMMRTIVGRMADQDMAAVADYIQGMH